MFSSLFVSCMQQDVMFDSHELSSWWRCAFVWPESSGFLIVSHILLRAAPCVYETTGWPCLCLQLAEPSEGGACTAPHMTLCQSAAVTHCLPWDMADCCAAVCCVFLLLCVVATCTCAKCTQQQKNTNNPKELKLVRLPAGCCPWCHVHPPCSLCGWEWSGVKNTAAVPGCGKHAPNL
jgi:hypothetical protein